MTTAGTSSKATRAGYVVRASTRCVDLMISSKSSERVLGDMRDLMNFAPRIEFDSLMESVALHLLGEPTQKRGNERRYGNRGSLSINLANGTWFDHEANEGGGVLDLIRRQGYEQPEAWLRSEGLMAQPLAINSFAPKIVKASYNAKEFSYADESGKLLYQVVRREPKHFTQRRPNGNGGWIWSLGGTRRVLYRLPQLRPAIERAETIYIVEGEKDADALGEFGLTATTNAGGANKWRVEYAEALRGADVVIIGDNDQAGRDHVTQVASSLSGVASRVRVLDLAAAWPECPLKGDISDWLAAGHTVVELDGLTAASPDWIVAEPDTDDTKVAVGDIRNVAPVAWPEPLSLPEGLSPVENFDLEFIPPAIGPWVGDISERMQCPPEYIAVSAMVGLGSVLGRKIAIRPQRKTDWLEVANFWGCVVGRPGMMKSPAMMEALRPLFRLETMARDAYGIEAARYAQELEVHELRRGAAEAAAKAALRKDVMASIAASPPPPERPKERRYIANDVTYEKLGEILADNPNGVLAYRDELVSLLKTLDREEYAPARGFF